MNLDLISAEKVLYSSQNATIVTCPGIDGIFQIMNNHAPLVSALKNGIITVEDNSQKHTFNIKSGILECKNDNVNILIEE